MSRKIPFLTPISNISTIIGGTLLFAMAFFISVEVLLRKFFSLTTGGAEEFSSYTLAIISTWAFSFTLLEKEHIRIDVLYTKLADSLQRTLDLVALIALAGFVLPATYFSFFVVQTSFLRGSKANTPLQTLLWIPQTLWFAGLVFFALVVICVITLTVKHFLRKEFRIANDLSGCPLLEEDIEEESGIVTPQYNTERGDVS